MKEPEQHFSPDSIDQQTERFFDQFPAQESRLIADLYQTYTSYAQEHNRSLQRIWSRFAQAQEHHLPLQEGQKRTGSTHLSQSMKDVNADRPDAPVPGSFQRPPQPLPRGLRRSLWNRLSGGVAVAVVLIIILIWVLLTHAFPMQNPQTASGASLTLGGGPQLNNTVVFLVKSSEGGQYLETISFDTYDGNGHTWSTTPVSGPQLPANKRMVSEGSPVHLVTQQINLVNPPEGQPYIFGAGQIASVNQSTTVLINKTTRSPIAVLLNNGQHPATGEQYTVQSYVSSADIRELKSVPLPADAPKLPPNYNGPLPPTYYNPAILSAYLQLPKIDPRVKALALQVTAGAHTMYDKAVALESFLREYYTYNVNVSLPPGQEGVSWFLFNSGHQGFCNYFATAMAIMARELGIPTRVVIGYTSGTYDAKAHDWVVRGSDAHVWTQIYFAGYGWINFEPSPSFSQFTRPL